MKCPNCGNNLDADMYPYICEYCGEGFSVQGGIEGTKRILKHLKNLMEDRDNNRLKKMFWDKK